MRSAVRQRDLRKFIPETRRFNARLRNEMLRQRRPHELPVDAARATWTNGSGPFAPPIRIPEAEEWAEATPHGLVRLRVFVPQTDIRATYLHFHGGGWTIGSADMQDQRLWALARHIRVAVASVHYRLAPEDPYPAAPDDCEHAALWLVDHARDAFGTDQLIIGGESAGAHLAVVTLLRLRDRYDAARRFAGVNIAYGVYDLSMTPSQRVARDDPVVPRPAIDWMYDCFAPATCSEERTDPDISPLYANLHGLPPLMLSIGALDPFVDDSLFLAARSSTAGTPTLVAYYPESLHGFDGFPVEMARFARRRQESFLAEVLEP